jgi:hypothetical protein
MSSEGQAYLVILLVLVFLPALIARGRRHNSTPAIAMLVVVLGVLSIFVISWPLVIIGWLVCFVWALTGNTRTRDEKQAKLNAEYFAREAQKYRQQQMTSSHPVQLPTPIPDHKVTVSYPWSRRRI